MTLFLIFIKSEHHNMVWEVKTNQMPNAVQKLLLVMDKRASGVSDSLELLQCNENLPSSPGYNSCDEHMELGKQNSAMRLILGGSQLHCPPWLVEDVCEGSVLEIFNIFLFLLLK